MNLKEFVTTALVEIAEGVQDAQVQYKKTGGAVNPCHIQRDNTSGLFYKGKSGLPDDQFSITNIEFEIGLADNSGSEQKTGIGVVFGAIGLGGNKKEQENTASVTRVKFSVPVKLPAQSL